MLSLRQPRPQAELAAVAAVLLLAAVAGALIIAEGAALGWDESVYALGARGVVTGISDPEVVRAYRPPGLPVIAAIATVAGFADAALRSVTLVLGVGALLAAWLLARLVFGRGAAILGLLACVGSSVVLRELPLLHNDLASTGALLLLMAVVWRALESRALPGWTLLVAAPIAAGSFYLRYGVLPALLGIALTACLLWPRKLLASKGPVLATVFLFLLLMVPHLARAIIETGRPWGILTLAADQVNTSSPLDSLLLYVGWIPTTLAGPVATLFVAAGAALALVQAARSLDPRRRGQRARGVAWLALPAVIAAAATLIVSHAEARYVVFSLVLVTLLGAEAIRRGSHRISRLLPVLRRRETWVLPMVALVVATGVTALVGRQVLRERRGEPGGDWYRQPALAIAAATDTPCVVATSLVPMVAWYSECRPLFLTRTTPDVLLAEPAAAHWVVLTSSDVDRVDPMILAAYDWLGSRRPVAEHAQEARYGRAYRLDP